MSRLVFHLTASLTGHRRASFRLRSLLIAVVLIALGLAFAHEMRRKELRRQVERRERLIRLVVEGRSRLAEDYEKQSRANLEQVEFHRSRIERFESLTIFNGDVLKNGSRE